MDIGIALLPYLVNLEWELSIFLLGMLGLRVQLAFEDEAIGGP